MEENKNITEEELYDLGYKSMMLYGVNVNLARAIPQISDGLKPIHRRTLYALWKLNRFNFVTAKTALGDVGHYAPHGDLGLNLMFGRMCQTFSNTVPLLTANGNPGTINVGDNTAAARYWSLRVSDFAKDVYFSEFDEKANMVPNYDYKLEEPSMLPCKFPVILLNGTIGIGYCMSSTIPPYNLNELADATLKLLDDPDAKIRLIPDSPTGCDIIVRDENTFVMQSSFEIDNLNYTITIRNTPYTKFIRKIQKDIWALQDSPNAIPEILHADDDSDLINDENNIKFVIRCKPCNLYTIINKLFKMIPDFRYTITTKNMIVVDTDFHTCEYNVRQILLSWIRIRMVEKRNWLMRELVDKTRRYNMLDGKAFMLNKENLPTTIKVFRSCKTTDEIVSKLVNAFKGKISSSQANYISEAKFKHLTEEEYKKTMEELKTLNDEISVIRSAISTKENIKKSIADDIREIKEKYGRPRRSKIINPNSTERNNVSVAQILIDGSVIFSETENPEHLASDITPISDNKVCLIDERGQFIWIDTNKTQHGKPITLTSVGKCVMGKCMCVCSNTRNNILMLTNRGRVKLMSIGGIPSNLSKKTLIPLNDDEHIVSILELQNTDNDILIYTKDGMGKRIKTSDLFITSINSLGQFIIKDVDNVSGMFLVNDSKPLLVYVTLLGRMRVNNTKFLVSGKKFGNMKPIIKLSPQDDLVAVYCVNKDDVVQLNHADGRVSTVNVSSLPVSTMATPPERPKHVPATKLIRAIIL